MSTTTTKTYMYFLRKCLDLSQKEPIWHFPSKGGRTVNVTKLHVSPHSFYAKICHFHKYGYFDPSCRVTNLRSKSLSFYSKILAYISSTIQIHQIQRNPKHIYQLYCYQLKQIVLTVIRNIGKNFFFSIVEHPMLKKSQQHGFSLPLHITYNSRLMLIYHLYNFQHRNNYRHQNHQTHA